MKSPPRELDLVSSFMNLPISQAQRSTPFPRQMEHIVEKLWEDWKIGDEGSKESIISANWQKIVGTKLAGKCAPVNLSGDGKTLHIRSASSTIKQELTFKREEMIRKINQLPSCKSVIKMLIQ
jgi:hypothetical protein